MRVNYFYMVEKAASRSIFKGTDEVISSVFGLGPGKHLKQKSTCRQLTPGSLSTSDFVALVSDFYSRMESNLTARIPSRENLSFPKIRSAEIIDVFKERRESVILTHL